MVKAASRREADARRARQRPVQQPGAVAAVPAVPFVAAAVAAAPAPAAQPQSPSVDVTVGQAEEGLDGSLSEDEVARREALVSQARLRYAALEGDVETIDLLLRGSTVGRRPRPPVPPDVASDDGWTPLMYACLHGHYDAARLLISRGANVGATNMLLDTPLALSAAPSSDGVVAPEEGSSRATVAALLLEAGAAVDSANEMGMTALHRAALQGVSAVARVLLRHGARPELLSKHGLSAVDLAAVGSDVRETIVKAQLKRGRQRAVGRGLSSSIDLSLRSFVAHNSEIQRAQTSQSMDLMGSLSEQVIDRHLGFSGVPSWQRIASIDSRLQELAPLIDPHAHAAREHRTRSRKSSSGKRRVGSASMELRKLNLSDGGTSGGGGGVDTAHGGGGGESELHVVAEGQHIEGPEEARKREANSFASIGVRY